MFTLLLTLACANPDGPSPLEPAPPALATPEPPAVAPPPPAATPEAPIALLAPSVGQRLRSPIEVRGTASVWEGRLTVRLLDAKGTERATQSTSASASAPARGEFSASLQAPVDLHGPAAIEAFYASARDGSPQGLVHIDVTLE